MKIFLLFVLLTPLKESFKERNYWRVTSFRNQARDLDDSIFVLLSARRTLRTEVTYEYLRKTSSVSIEFMVTLTSNIFQDSLSDSITIHNLKILRDSIPDLRDFFTLKLVEKYLRRNEVNAALAEISSLSKARSRQKAINLITEYTVEKKDLSLVYSVLEHFQDQKEALLFFSILKALWEGDTINARKKAYILAKNNEKYPYLLRIIELFDDTLKAYIYFVNSQYRDADRIFRKIKTKRYILAQIISAYRIRDYPYVIDLFERNRSIISSKDLESILLQIGYSYWQVKKPLKALEYLSYAANLGNELASREILDILIKENSNILEDFIENIKIKSQELNYVIGLYYLYKKDTINAVNYLKKAITGKNTSIKAKAYYFYTELTGDKTEPAPKGNLLDYFSILTNGLLVTTEKEPQSESDSPQHLRTFKILLLWGDTREALSLLENNENLLIGAIKLADYLGYDHLKINLALRYLNNNRRDEIPLYLLNWIFPTNYYSAIKPIAEFYKVKPELILALMREESRFNPEAVSPAGAIGLMQLMPYTARTLYPEVSSDSLRIPDLNITLGIKYLSILSDTFPNIIDLLCSYNAGPTRVKIWRKTYLIDEPLLYMELIPFRETREYVQRILRSIIIYEYLLRRG
ncbi:MAG: lytic transglycosylase domain-containing protein [candidate division WOR-3 bacterium]